MHNLVSSLTNVTIFVKSLDKRCMETLPLKDPKKSFRVVPSFKHLFFFLLAKEDDTVWNNHLFSASLSRPEAPPHDNGRYLLTFHCLPWLSPLNYTDWLLALPKQQFWNVCEDNCCEQNCRHPIASTQKPDEWARALYSWPRGSRGQPVSAASRLLVHSAGYRPLDVCGRQMATSSPLQPVLPYFQYIIYSVRTTCSLGDQANCGCELVHRVARTVARMAIVSESNQTYHVIKYRLRGRWIH